MKIIEVSTPAHIKEFLKLPVRLYKNEKHWIRPLDNDVEEVFDARKNKFFRHGECIRWILVDDNNQTIGRTAAFINRKAEKEKNSLKQELRVGGMGFFESIDDQKVAFKLFDTCVDWLKERGINTIDGPINFGERDNWWGLLVEGHDIDPNYKMPYTFPYYQAFFENYGFKVYFKQLTFAREVNTPLKPKYKEKADRIMNNSAYSFKCLDMKKLEQFTEDFRTIYNKAWVKHTGVKGMTSLQAKSIMKQMKPILDPDIVYFAYHNNEPIAFFFNLIEVNQIFKHLNGKLNVLGKLKFLYHKKFRTVKKMVGRGFGVVPEFQGKGLEAAIVEFCRQMVQGTIRGRYIDYEMNWIGDFNPTMVKVASEIGDVAKTHITYRKMLDKSLTFERCKEIK
ncbi:MAG: hypothetical protein AB8B61_09130 [Cyclobacteriaceae bacterium]